MELLAGRGSAAEKEIWRRVYPITSFMLQLRCGNPQEMNSYSFHGVNQQRLPVQGWGKPPNKKGPLALQAALG
jgi:hypothetical protein